MGYCYKQPPPNEGIRGLELKGKAKKVDKHQYHANGILCLRIPSVVVYQIT